MMAGPIPTMAGLDKKRDPVSKIKTKRAGGMAQAVECLPSKREVLSLYLSTDKKKK
jgi:hypothetical protein